jgi:hypothetical protein
VPIQRATLNSIITKDDSFASRSHLEKASRHPTLIRLSICGFADRDSINYCLKYVKGTGIVLELLSENVVSPRSVPLIAKV